MDMAGMIQKTRYGLKDYQTYHIGQTVIDKCDEGWQAVTGTNVNQDPLIFKEPTKSTRVYLTTGWAPGGVLTLAAYKDLPYAMDLRECLTFLYWIRPSADLAAGDSEIVLSDAAACTGIKANLLIPAIKAHIWNAVVVAITPAVAATLGAIISVGLRTKFASLGLLQYIDHIRGQYLDYFWTDDELEEHIGHALGEYSKVYPQELEKNFTTTNGSRKISIASLVDRIEVKEVQYPSTSEYPANIVAHRVKGDNLYLLEGDLPDGVKQAIVNYGALQRIEDQEISRLMVESCDSIWTAKPNVVASVDSSDYKEGVGSAKIDIAAAFTIGTAAYYDIDPNISAVDFKKYELWIKSSINQNAADLRIYLFSTSDASDGQLFFSREIAIPALIANLWTKVDYENPVFLTGTIGSVGLMVVIDNGACTIRLDAIKNRKVASATTVPERDWDVIAMGGVAYALQAWSNFSMSGASELDLRPTEYQTRAEDARQRFENALAVVATLTRAGIKTALTIAGLAIDIAGLPISQDILKALLTALLKQSPKG